MNLNISIGRSNMDINRYYDAISSTGLVQTQLFSNMKNHIAKLENQPFDGAEQSFGGLIADGTVNAILTDSINATNVAKETLPQKGKIILEMLNKLQFMEIQHVFDTNPDLRNLINGLGREIRMFMESSAQSVLCNLLLEKVCVKSVEALNNMRQVIEMADTQPKEIWRQKAVEIGVLTNINVNNFVTDAYYKMKTSAFGQGQNTGAPITNTGNSFGSTTGFGNLLGDPNGGNNPFTQPTTFGPTTGFGGPAPVAQPGPTPVTLGTAQQGYAGDYKIGSAMVGLGNSYPTGQTGINTTPVGNTFNNGSVNMNAGGIVAPTGFAQPAQTQSAFGTTGFGGPAPAGPTPVNFNTNPFTQASVGGSFVVGGGDAPSNNNNNNIAAFQYLI